MVAVIFYSPLFLQTRAAHITAEGNITRVAHRTCQRRIELARLLYGRCAKRGCLFEAKREYNKDFSYTRYKYYFTFCLYIFLFLWSRLFLHLQFYSRYLFQLSAALRLLAKRLMHQRPQSATKVYIIRLHTTSCPPNTQEIISNLKSPIEPQLSAPIIISASEILSNILFTPFGYTFPTANEKYTFFLIV